MISEGTPVNINKTRLLNVRRIIGLAALLIVGGTATVMTVAFLQAVLGWGRP